MLRKWVVTCVLLLSPMMLAAADWVKVGDKAVNYQTTTDTLKLPKYELNVSHLKLVCTQGTVNLHKLTMHLSDGGQKVVDNLGVLTQGLSSRAMSVPAGLDLKSIEFEYDSVGSQTLSLTGVTKKGKLDVMVKFVEK